VVGVTYTTPAPLRARHSPHRLDGWGVLAAPAIPTCSAPHGGFRPAGRNIFHTRAGGMSAAPNP